MLGTAVGVLGSESIGDLPLKNWKQGGWKEQAQRISGERMAETILYKRYYCGACPVGCGREVKISEGPYSGVEGAGPEYETLGMLGACCLVDDLEAVAYANELCNRFGLDTISPGSVIAFAMELYEHGMLPAEDLDGIKPEWGSAEAVIALIRKIAEQEGIGQVLGQGVKKAAEQIGGLAHEFAIHVKGLELPAHDPRSYNSLAVDMLPAIAAHAISRARRISLKKPRRCLKSGTTNLKIVKVSRERAAELPCPEYHVPAGFFEIV